MDNNWFRSYFDDFYLKWFLEGIPEEITENQIKLIEEVLDLKKGDKILDLFCGIGRHSLALSKMGYSVTAIDSSEKYIEVLMQSADKLNLDTKSYSMDAREIKYIEEFDSIIIMFVSFGYFNEEDNFKLLKKISDALKHNGKLLLDLENRDYILKNYVREKWREKDYGFLMERHKFDPITSRQKTKRVILSNCTDKREMFRDIRLYSAHEIINMAENAGLKPLKLMGDYDKSDFQINSPRLLFAFNKG